MFRNRNRQWLWLVLELPHWLWPTSKVERSTYSSEGWKVTFQNHLSQEQRASIIPWPRSHWIYTEGNWCSNEHEDNFRAEESGSSHLQDGYGQREGSRPSFLSENVIDYLFGLSSICGCELQGWKPLHFPWSKQHGASHSSKSEANVHLKPSTWEPKFYQYIFIS